MPRYLLDGENDAKNVYIKPFLLVKAAFGTIKFVPRGVCPESRENIFFLH
jgi:hypothetical protein